MTNYTVRVKNYLVFGALAAGLMIWLLASAANSAGAAQDNPEAWGAPINLSQSGTAAEPQMVLDSNGNYHILWRDELSIFYYSRGQGSTWTQPSPVVVPFGNRLYYPDLRPGEVTPLFTPTLIADGRGLIHAFWLDEVNGLWLSSVAADSFGAFEAWTPRQRVAEAALSFSATMDAAGRLHVSYVRPIQSPDFPAGVYYRQSPDGAITWTTPVLLYESFYFRSLDRASAGIQLISDGLPEAQHLFLVWENRPLQRVFFARSDNAGVNWTVPREIDSRQEEDSPEATSPSNIRVAAGGNNVHLTWQAGHGDGASCRQYHQWSPDNGNTWYPRPWEELATLLHNVGGCGHNVEVVVTRGGQAYLVASYESGSYLLAWNGEKWSDEQFQGPLVSFTNPVTFKPVVAGCRNYLITPDNQLVALFCDTAEGGDIWLMSRPLEDTRQWFPTVTPTPLWNPPWLIANGDSAITSSALVADNEGRLHALWSRQGGGAIEYARWDGVRWTRPAQVLVSPAGKTEQPAVTLDPSGRLLTVWSGGQAGQVYYSLADTSRSTQSSEWSRPVAVPSLAPAGNAPDIVVGRDGAVYVAYAIPFNENRGIYLSVSHDGGTTWDAVKTVFDAVAADWERVDQPRLTVTSDGYLHLLWKRGPLPTSMGEPLLYYARSEDGGESWLGPELVVEFPVAWADIISVGERTVHVVWQEGSGNRTILYHQYSVDNGFSWTRPRRISGFGEVTGPASLTIDQAGQLHLLQMSINNAGNQTLQRWTWEDDRWATGETVILNETAIPDTNTLSAAVLPSGELAAVFAGSFSDPNTGQVHYPLFFTGRSLDLPDEMPTALPPLTPTPLPNPTETPTPGPSPTPTVFFPIDRDTGGGVQLGPINTNEGWVGSILGALTAGIIVIVVFFVGIRTVRGGRR